MPSVPAWLPSHRELQGLGLAVGLALVALALTPVAFSGSPWASPVVVAIGLGALVLNSPVAGWIGLKVDSGREGDAYERGLRYTGKWVLRLAIVLMGLKARTDLIEPQLLARVLLVLVVTLPTTFFVAHATAGLLKLRREMADLVAIGTMICGASAINALAPTVFARRRDQGLAVTAIFLFSVAALMALLPIGTALGLDTESAGLWAGLAVNDLSSSVAVGGQFGEDESVLAAMAKTVRIVLLGPLLLVFSQFRRRAPAEDSVRLRLTAHFPLFVVGYLLLFGVRALGDRMFTAAGPAGGAWAALLAVNDGVVSLAIAAVCASIGLQIHVRTLVDVESNRPVAFRERPGNIHQRGDHESVQRLFSGVALVNLQAPPGMAGALRGPGFAERDHARTEDIAVATQYEFSADLPGFHPFASSTHFQLRRVERLESFDSSARSAQILDSIRGLFRDGYGGVDAVNDAPVQAERLLMLTLLFVHETPNHQRL
ncbi:MAG: putative sulfate exporter family transporter [Acidobacteria bacterium]|nr:putative sulfate exporter family transporter [Acidobacteriota bacterium]